MFTIVMYNSLGCELDRITGDDIGDILRRYADEGCIDYGDKLVILPEAEEEEATPRYAIQPMRDSFKGTPEGADGSTWFVPCEDEAAEVFALIDKTTGEIEGDYSTRSHAEERARLLLG